MDVMNVLERLQKEKCLVAVSKLDNGDIKITAQDMNKGIGVTTIIPRETSNDKAFMMVQAKLKKEYDAMLDKLITDGEV